MKSRPQDNPHFFDKPAIKVFLSYYGPHMALFSGDLVCALLVAACDIAFPMMSRYTLNTIIPAMEMRPFVVMIAAMLVMYILRSLFNYFITYWGHVFGTQVEADMRRDLFHHIERQGFPFFDRHRTGHIMSRVTTDLFEVTELAHHGPEDVIISLLTLLGSFAMMLTIRWELAVIIFAFLPLMVLRTALSRKSLNETSRSVKEKTSDINAALESSISGSRVTKAFTNEAFEEEKFEEGNKAFRIAKKKFYHAMAGFHVKIDFQINFLNVAVIAVGGWFIMQEKMTIADLVAANLFVASFSQPIRRLSNFVEQYTTGMAGFTRFLEIMRTHEETVQKEGAAELKKALGNIEYRNVDFAYSNNVPVLKNVNLSVESGKTLALVGPSGAGKTTFCHLLPRFYELTGGRILLDGTDIRDYTVSSLRRQIGLVQQDVFLFAGTIRDNIAYGNIHATQEEIEEAAKRAEIHEDILKMPNGYDTIVGERGLRLSGGQKQRVSIARTFLKNPPVLILDEATSALDTATEQRIQRSFDELSKGRTSIIIAHRLSTIRNADCIAVISGEGIAECGTHRELIEKNGIYAELYHNQFEQNTGADEATPQNQ